MRLLISIAAACVFASSAHAAAGPQPPLPAMDLQVGTRVLRAEVAASPAQLEQGLVQREHLAADGGMLFVFPRAVARACMWMNDTVIPLSVAFIDVHGRVINIADMKPRTEKRHCARKAAHYALEANAGFFAAAGVTRGAQIGGLPPPVFGPNPHR